jgi:hypothetical protein
LTSRAVFLPSSSLQVLPIIEVHKEREDTSKKSGPLGKLRQEPALLAEV